MDDVKTHLERHLIPFFAPRVDHVKELTFEDCEDFVDHMAGSRPVSTPVQTVVAEAREVTLARGRRLVRQEQVRRTQGVAYWQVS